MYNSNCIYFDMYRIQRSNTWSWTWSKYCHFIAFRNSRLEIRISSDLDQSTFFLFFVEAASKHILNSCLTIFVNSRFICPDEAPGREHRSSFFIHRSGHQDTTRSRAHHDLQESEQASTRSIWCYQKMFPNCSRTSKPVEVQNSFYFFWDLGFW